VALFFSFNAQQFKNCRSLVLIKNAEFRPLAVDGEDRSEALSQLLITAKNKLAVNHYFYEPKEH
jgi:hypothetical protein